MVERMMLELAEIQFSVLQVHCPLSRGRLKSIGHGKLSIHFCADLETIETIFRIIVSVNQLSLHGAVAEICEEYESLHERTGRPVVMGQSSSSLVLSVIKTEVPLTQRMKIFYCNNIENELKSCHNRINWINFVWMQDFWVLLRMDSISWRKTLEISHNFMQWPVVNTLFQEKTEHHNQKDGFKGTPNIGPVLQVATSYLHGTYGVEIRIWSLNRHNSHSWVRISHGSNKFVMDLNNNEQEIPEVQLEEYASKLDAKDFVCRSKAKAKPQRREPAGSSPRTVPIGKRTWTDVEPGKYSFSDFEVSKKVTFLLCHSKQMHREEDWAVHFWRMKENLHKHFPYCPHWSDDKWKKSMAGGGGNKKRYLYCIDSFRKIVYLRALQGHSGRNFIDPSLQDNVLIPSGFFEYIYHVGCAINLHSIINSGLIPGGQNSSKRQTVFLLPVDPRDKGHKDPEKIDLNIPRRAQYLHSAWKQHQDAVYLVDIDLAIRKVLTFCQTQSNAIILQETLPAYCIPKVVRMETGEVLYEKVFMSPRPPPKISLKHEWKRELGSEHAQRSEAEQLSRSFQSNQPLLNPFRERTERPVFTRGVIAVSDDSQTRSVDGSETFNVGDETLRERTERPVSQ